MGYGLELRVFSMGLNDKRLGSLQVEPSFAVTPKTSITLT